MWHIEALKLEAIWVVLNRCLLSIIVLSIILLSLPRVLQIISKKICLLKSISLKCILLCSITKFKSFCELNYDIDMPMSETLSVRGQDAHPFFKAVKAESGFAPKWNFNKILIGADGQVVETWGSLTRPLAAKLTKVIEDELSKSQ